MDALLDYNLIDCLEPDHNDIIILSAEKFHMMNNKNLSNLEYVIDSLGIYSAKVLLVFYLNRLNR